MATVSCTRMSDMTEADLRLINADADEDARDLPDRLMKAVVDLERFQGPLKVSRLEHSLQSATRAHRAGKDREHVAEFCEQFDQNCFDPEYDSLPLEFFRPMVEEVFGHPREAQ